MLNDKWLLSGSQQKIDSENFYNLQQKTTNRNKTLNGLNKTLQNAGGSLIRVNQYTYRP